MPFVVLLVPFFAIVASFVLIGLSQTHTAQHGSSGIKGFLDTAIRNSLVGELVGVGKKAARSLVSRYAAAHLKMLTSYLHGMASLWKQEFRAMRAEARATANVAHELERAIPREAHKAAAPALRRAKVANRHATHALDLGHANARELHRFRVQTRARLKADAHAIDVTIPRDIGRVRRREEELARDQTKLRERTGLLERGAEATFDWIRSHPLSAVTGVFAGAVAVALTRLGYGFVRCRSWRNVAKRMNCGVGSSLLNLLDNGLGGLLGALLTYETVTHLEDLVRIGQEIEHGVASGLQDLLNVKD